MTFIDDAIESYDDPFPSGAGFSIGGGKSTRTFRYAISSVDDLTDAITEILGDTSLDVGDGRMQRTPPIADPMFRWLDASTITNMKGRGLPNDETADDELEVPSMPDYPLADIYDITVEFTPRSYPVVTDDSVALIDGTWYPDSNTDSTSSQQTFRYADETCRYTSDPDIVSAFEYITAQQGNMKFKTNGTTYGGFNPNGKAFPAKLKMLQPNMVVKVTTFQMPYRYLTSSRSYITGGSTRAPWIGRVNQNDLYINGQKFPRGSLQYLSFSAEKFTPPVPERSLFAPGVFSTEKLMNLSLTFLYTLRTATDKASDPSNKNYIQYGHNLLPWVLTRKFHYAEAASGFPSWVSAPLELLWTDPDFIQTVG